MGKFLVYAGLFALSLYCLFDAIGVPRLAVRLLPKWLWLVLIVVVPALGPAGWLTLGRPHGVVDGRFRRRPPAPDDDTAFLRGVSDDLWRRRMRERRGDDTSTTG